MYLTYTADTDEDQDGSKSPEQIDTQCDKQHYLGNIHCRVERLCQTVKKQH